jgi:hypothetical protein
VKQFLPDRIHPRLLAVLTAALLLLAAGAIAACGGGGSGQDLDTVLNATFGGKKKVDSGRLDMRLTADLQGAATLKDPVTVKIGGPFESRGDKKVPKLDLELSAGTGGQTFSAGVISTGTKGYINFQGTDYEVPTKLFDQFERELRQQDNNQNNIPDLSDLGVNPRDWLENPKDEGTENVGGVETIHISSDVNVDKLVDDIDELLGKTGQLGLSRAQRQQLPTSLPDATKKQIRDSVKSASLDVYTGKDDKVLRKLRVKLDFEVAQNLRTQTSGISGGKIDFTVEASEVNKPQKIEEPSNARPLAELQQQLNSLGALGNPGGATGTTGSSGSGSGGSGSGSAGTTDSPKTRRYLKCVEAAQGVAEIGDCASLLK